jgi:Fic family protein
MTYTPITDLAESDRALEPTLTSLIAAWRDRRQELSGRDELERLHEKMRRRWAIDTGMIEGLYSISRGTTELLIDRGLHADLISHGESDVPATQLVAYLHDHAEVYDWLFEFVRQERPFGTSWIRELHQLLTRHQSTTEAVDGLERRVDVPLQHGVWKSLPNNPRRPDGTVHEYAPPEIVPSEIDNLVRWHLEHLNGGTPPEVEAAWLHHRFTQIHPFQDGNGRVARAIASLVLIRAECFPFSVPPERKSDYISALEAADGGQLRPLIEMISAQQRREFGRALGVAEQLADEHQLFSAAFAKAARTRDARAAGYEDVKDVASALIDVGEAEFRERRREFAARAREAGVDNDQRVYVYRPPENQRHYYRTQIEEVAHKAGYFANFAEFRDWIRLTIVNDMDDRAHVLVVAMHGNGRSFKGVLAAVAFVETIDRAEVENPRSPTIATEDPFEFGYLDAPDHVTARFREWLQAAWLSVLKEWQEGL